MAVLRLQLLTRCLQIVREALPKARLKLYKLNRSAGVLRSYFIQVSVKCDRICSLKAIAFAFSLIGWAAKSALN
jgi:hypothetical protein